VNIICWICLNGESLPGGFGIVVEDIMEMIIILISFVRNKVEVSFFGRVSFLVTSSIPTTKNVYGVESKQLQGCRENKGNENLYLGQFHFNNTEAPFLFQPRSLFPFE
jgi:hypothetical protein